MILVYLLCHLRVTDSPPSLGKFGIDIEHRLIEQTDLKTCRSIEKTREWLSQLSGCTRQTQTVHQEKNNETHQTHLFDILSRFRYLLTDNGR